MKKIITLLCVLSPAFGFSQADTLLYENFDVDPTAGFNLVSSGNDVVWVDYDVDNLLDGSGASRPGNWFWSSGGFGTNDTTGCLFSNSWFAPAGKALNYLILPPLQIVDNTAVIHWSSAPRQTPLYLDGYKVVVSTTDNFETSFTDTIFVAAEYTGTTGLNDSIFAGYTFSPGYVHGEDGTGVEYYTDSTSLLGNFLPFTASLAAYSGQTIYVAFLHDSNDDNLISIDDILVTGTIGTGIDQLAVENKLTISPNPASDMIRVNYLLPASSQIKANVFDEKGSLVKSHEKGMQIAGAQQIDLNVNDLANGKYFIQLVAGNKYTMASFVIAR